MSNKGSVIRANLFLLKGGQGSSRASDDLIPPLKGV